MKEPKVISMFNDDGSHSHYALIDVETGDKLWSECPEECKAKGYPVTQANGDSTSDESLPIGGVVGSFGKGFRIDFVPNNYMRKGNAKLLIHPDDIPSK
jgi:hypothetical protein